VRLNLAQPADCFEDAKGCSAPPSEDAVRLSQLLGYAEGRRVGTSVSPASALQSLAPLRRLTVPFSALH
jgi:hypothetical protein